MHSALIPSELGYPAITLGRITGTPEVRISRSSRTKEILSSMIVRPHQIETDNFVTLREYFAKGPDISAELCMSPYSSDYILSATNC